MSGFDLRHEGSCLKPHSGECTDTRLNVLVVAIFLHDVTSSNTFYLETKDQFKKKHILVSHGNN